MIAAGRTAGVKIETPLPGRAIFLFAALPSQPGEVNPIDESTIVLLWKGMTDSTGSAATSFDVPKELANLSFYLAALLVEEGELSSLVRVDIETAARWDAGEVEFPDPALKNDDE